MTRKRKEPGKPAKVYQRVRISDEMRRCVEIMATEGIPLPVAAERAGITRDAAVKNMKKPHILRLLNQRVKEVRDNAAQEAYLRINHMSQTVGNDRLKFDASRWVAGVDGIAPVQKVQGQHHHSHSFQGFEYPDLKTVEGQAEDTDNED